MSPIDGEVIREALPYKNDLRFRGVLIRGTGAWTGCQVEAVLCRRHVLWPCYVRSGDRHGSRHHAALPRHYEP